MPRSLAAKRYPALVDVYREVTRQDPVDGSVTSEWDYAHPVTLRCNWTALTGLSEQFGKTYTSGDSVKIEIPWPAAQNLSLGLRVGNLRRGSAQHLQIYNVDRIRLATGANGEVIEVQLEAGTV